MFEHLYRAMTSLSYKQDLLKLDIPEPEGKKGKKNKKGDVKKNVGRRDDDEALSVASDLNAPNHGGPARKGGPGRTGD